MVRKRRPKSAGATPARLPRLRATGAGSTPGHVSGEKKGTAGPAVNARAESRARALGRVWDAPRIGRQEGMTIETLCYQRVVLEYDYLVALSVSSYYECLLKMAQEENELLRSQLRKRTSQPTRTVP